MHARYLEDRGDRLTLVPSPLDRLTRGALLAFVIAPLVLLGASTAAGIVADDDVSFLVGWGAAAFVAGALAGLGFVLMATASRVARRAVRVDLAERTLERPGCPVEVLRGVEAVRVRPRRWPGSGFALELAHADGRVTPLIEAPRGRGPELARAAEHLADAIGASARIAARATRDRPLVPRDPRVASALCYAPIDGLSQGLCVFYLMTAIDPFVRFNAKQSLLMLPVEALGATLAVAVGAPLALAAPDDLGVAALACPLVLFACARVALRMTAAMRARRGMIWIQPWLAPIARRWAPS